MEKIRQDSADLAQISHAFSFFYQTFGKFLFGLFLTPLIWYKMSRTILTRTQRISATTRLVTNNCISRSSVRPTSTNLKSFSQASLNALRPTSWPFRIWERSSTTHWLTLLWCYSTLKNLRRLSTDLKAAISKSCH